MSDHQDTSYKNNAGEEDEHLKSNYTTQMEQDSASREAEASVYGCTEKNELTCGNDTGDSHFESRPPSFSFNSDSTVNSYVADEGKLEANSPALESYKTDTVAADKESVGEGQQNGIPATEENPFLQSVKYLEKHQILRLFQVSCSVHQGVLKSINFYYINLWYKRYSTGRTKDLTFSFSTVDSCYHDQRF